MPNSNGVFNAIGLGQLRQVLIRNHTTEELTDAQVYAWAEDVQKNINEGNGAFIEIGGRYTFSGHPEVYHFDDSCVTKGERITDSGILNSLDDALADCDCGCHGDYTDHSMRLGESGRHSW